MIHELILKEIDLVKLSAALQGGHEFVVGTLPPGSTILSCGFVGSSFNYKVIYETPDETPCTISVGLAD